MAKQASEQPSSTSQAWGGVGPAGEQWGTRPPSASAAQHEPVGVSPLQCAHCERPIVGRHPSALYCRKACSKAAHNSRVQRRRAVETQAVKPCQDCGGQIELERLMRKGHPAMRCIPCGDRWRVEGRHVARAVKDGSYGKPSGRERVYAAVKAFEAPPPLVASTRGAANELVVAVDLMRRGYDVYRAVSPALACDLVVMRGALAMRVEVRSTSRDVRGTGRVKIPILPRDKGRFDVAALVEPNGTIHYRGLPDVQ